MKGKVAKLETNASEAQGSLSNSNQCTNGGSKDPLPNPGNTGEVDLQKRLRDALDTALHDGSLSAATAFLGNQNEKVEVLPVTQECIVEEVAPAPSAKFPWCCM